MKKINGFEVFEVEETVNIEDCKDVSAGSVNVEQENINDNEKN